MGTEQQNALRTARTEKLNKEIAILLDWLRTRLHSDHDELTTLTMLERKVSTIKQRVNKAGYDYIANLNKTL